MFRIKSLSLLFTIIFLVCVFCTIVSAEKGNLISGTYWMQVEPTGFDSIPGMLTLNADGVVLAAQYLSPFTNNGRGNWEKVGSRGAKGRFLSFGYNPDGTPSLIIEIAFEGTFDQSCESGEMDFVINWYAPGDNPLEDVPLFGNTGYFYLERIPTD